MDKRVERANQLFAEGLGCAPAVFAAFAPDYGMSEELALKTACGYRGGIGAMGDVCGVVTGAIMAIGLKYGHGSAVEKNKKAETAIHVQEFRKKFEQLNGSWLCRDLLGFDMSTPEGKAKMKQPGSHDICRKYVQDGAEILVEMGL